MWHVTTSPHLSSSKTALTALTFLFNQQRVLQTRRGPLSPKGDRSLQMVLRRGRPEKVSRKPLFLSSPNINRFAKIFTGRFSKKHENSSIFGDGQKYAAYFLGHPVVLQLTMSNTPCRHRVVWRTWTSSILIRSNKRRSVKNSLLVTYRRTAVTMQKRFWSDRLSLPDRNR